MVDQRERQQATERADEALTLSGEPLEPVYTPGDLERFDAESKLGEPGAYPFTRGVYPSMYRGRLWTMRQFAGFGSPAETNARYRFLLERGQGGLSVAFDMPTLMGRDSDDPQSLGEVGHCGVAVDSAAEPNPANCRIVHSRPRYIVGWVPRVNGNSAGKPSSVEGSHP